jgi:dTDP-4-dehydrorhamnose 3,5-epimerase
MIFTPLSLQGAWLIRDEPARDERGYFARSFCNTEFRQQGLIVEFPQHSVSWTRQRGTLRGLHYQESPHEEIKLVRCTRGSIHDVIVDLRADSPTLGQWLAFELTADNHLSLYIPGGFAHGFITLEPGSEVHYMISREYVPGHGRTVHWNDQDLAINWPLQPVVMSDNDRHAPLFRTLQPRSNDK